MRRPRLASVFRDLVLTAAAAVPAAGCVITDSTGCPDPFEGAAELHEPVDAELQALVDACRSGADLTACEPMCRELIGRQEGYDLTEWDSVFTCALVDQDGPGTLTAIAEWTWAPECIGGRRPAGYARGGTDRATAGGFFAEQARLEAASIYAFADLARALERHGAPRALVRGCRRAAGDEAVHAVLTARLARRHGGCPEAFAARAAAPTPSLEQLARDNAVEGCVRESWGALVATWQAQAARDPMVRAAMRRIAPDETAHAELSRAIDRWAHRKLAPAARARVADARAAALAELAPAAVAAPPRARERAAGLPPAPVAARLFDGLRAVA